MYIGFFRLFTRQKKDDFPPEPLELRRKIAFRLPGFGFVNKPEKDVYIGPLPCILTYFNRSAGTNTRPSLILSKPRAVKRAWGKWVEERNKKV